MDLETAFEHYANAITGELSPETVKWYESHLTNLVDMLGNRDIEEITANDLRRWRAAEFGRDMRYLNHPTRNPAEGGLSNATKRGRIRALRRFFAWLTEEHIIDRNPALRLRPPRKIEAVPKHNTDADLRALLDAAEKKPRDYALILFLAETGARVEGAHRLNIADLDLDNHTTTVREKYGKVREVYLTDTSVAALRNWLAARPKTESRAVFTSRCGTRLTTSGLYQILKRTAERANVTGRWNPHAFRHAYARSLIENGASLEVVSKLMGHSNIRVTADTYAVWTNSELQEKHAQFSRIANLENGGENE
jgi:site-specific recombinase XerD